MPEYPSVAGAGGTTARAAQRSPAPLHSTMCNPWAAASFQSQYVEPTGLCMALWSLLLPSLAGALLWCGVLMREPALWEKILERLEQEGLKNVLFTNCVKDENVKKVIPLITDLVSSSQRYQRAENVEYCIMVIGVPNVGKSSLINSMRRLHLKKGKASRVGGEPGITKAVLTRIQVSERPLMYLLDTPGVLAPRIESVEAGMKLALCGAIRDHLVGEGIMADYLLYTLNKQQQFSYVERYGLGEPSDDIESVLKRVALKLGKTHKVKVLTGTGDVNVIAPDYPAAAYELLRTFRKGELGQVLLD
ncbi:mitochondrial ribosome-associated GTPase 1 isoform X4 [Mauremys reevesii]|uniref:mitochondrial ribosome-associated GTPase 1 isoform X4 n=1 Tax=Mauremys reevesii TaxID=260615 RepID=UPI00193F17E4|nr:mitochondrial ribosome-associated GTPase 1 isoform X4 [Mauremys reevesii]XP_039403190.1 mitochondrial ribosome-associated GTPase 1 isoform X4 [Mauremys reevesii]